jgi:hypothetical protein
VRSVTAHAPLAHWRGGRPARTLTGIQEVPMLTLIAHAAAPLGLTLAAVLLHGWWQALYGVAPPGLELWLTLLPGLAVRALLPTPGVGIVLVTLVLCLQHLVLVAVAIGGWRCLALAQSSSPASSPGNRTSVKPNWLKSRTRIG